MLKKGSSGPKVKQLVADLRELNYYDGADTTTLDQEVYKSVRAFQMQNTDVAGRPLVVDGIVGPVTAGALDVALGRARASAALPAPSPIAAPQAGGSPTARAALAVALEELRLGHGEQGGNNHGPHVRKYLNGLAEEGNSWCAGFVSWCFSQSGHPMPFDYTVGARSIRTQMNSRGLRVHPTDADPPRPGDVIVWWRIAPSSWQGHVGLVYGYRDGVISTIEGNRSAKVARFDYTLGKIDKLLGFARAP